MIEHTVFDERWVSTALNPVRTTTGHSVDGIQSRAVSLTARARDSVVWLSDLQTTVERTVALTPGDPRDDADAPLHGDADGPGGV